MHGFVEYVDKKMRESRRHLGIVKKILEGQKMRVTDHREEDSPYIFVENPEKTLSFDGVRIYEIGGNLAYRVQKQERTAPYGRAYQLNLEDMYDDYMSDDFKEEEAAKQIIQSVAEELQKFFKKSAEAENEIRSAELDQNSDGLGKIIVRTSGAGDYSNQVTSKS